ncbi:MAG: aminotransferase class I/II-fold pyridoxal phosphate-dependent enzyme, partial [Thermoanaerobaculia bacterium]
VELKEEFGAFIIVDEAHSFGVLGRTGRGVTEHFALSTGVVDVITGSLSKAIPANGGFVAGRRDLVIYLQHTAAPLFFSAALCPPAVGAAKAAIEILDSEPERIAKAAANAGRLRSGLQRLGFDTGQSSSPLIPVITGQDERAYRLARDLLRQGVIATAVVHPAVPKGAARLRLCATAAHDAEDIEVALQAFARARAPHPVAAPPRRSRPGGTRLEIYEEIGEVDPVVWDALVTPGDLQASHRFVKLCQDSRIEDAKYRHVLLYQDGALAAIASLCRMTVNLDVLAPSALRGTAQRARRLFPEFLRLPVLFCGLPVSFGQSCLRFAPEADRAAALNTLAGTMAELGEELGSELLCFKEFGPSERADLDGLVRAGYLRLPSLPSCHLPLRWRSFDAYLADMRAGYRRQARLDRSTAQRLGLRVRRLADFGAESASLHRLYENVVDRTEYRLERLPRAFFENLNKGLADRASALLLERDDEVVAVAILLEAEDTMTFLLAGIDDRVNREHHCHPLLVSAVVAEAIRSGARNLELGQTAYGVKGRFGAETTPRWLYIRHRSPRWHRLLGLTSARLFPAHEITNRRVFRADGAPTLP